MRRGEDASSPFLPSHVLESSSFALKKQTGACYAGAVLIFRFGELVFLWLITVSAICNILIARETSSADVAVTVRVLS